MLRPERMSRVSVTGTKRVMPDVIDAVHGLNLLHLVDYDGSWAGFEPGDPMEGAEEASEKLVTVRSIESILGVEAEDAGAGPAVADDDLEAELESLREEVNELDDRRDELKEERRAVEERIAAAEPIRDLGIDLDLLSGYEHLTVRVGEGNPDAIADALTDLDGEWETFAGDGTVAIFARADPEALDDALVGVEFTAVEVPDAEGTPEEYVAELEAERERLDSRLETVENELEDLKLEATQFVLAAEERLTVEVQKAEAPLQFATTENAFVAEGWVPTDRYGDLEAAIREAAGEHVEVEELERADYEPPAHGHDEHETAADGGSAMAEGSPPVIQNNPGVAKPFELLVETISRPQYWDLDPTVVLFLAFPAFFGFMIGDVGYGLLYVAIGYWLWSSFESDGFRSLGGIAMWAGGFTALFGVLYGEIFGLHLITTYLWEGALHLHGAPMHKGLQPADIAYAQTWLVVVMLAGLVHLSVGYLFGFAQFTQGHGLRDAVLEKGSWLTLMLGVWVWIFSRHGAGVKPNFLYTVFNAPGASIPGASATVSEVQVAYPLGFGGLPETVGLAGLGIAVVGFVLLLAGEGAQGLLEFLDVLVNVLSYARIAAVLLAKAGMAFVVNLLFFGVYTEGEPAEYHFMLSHGPQYVLEHHAEAEILFGGLMHSGVAGVVAGLAILVIGHLIVLALGVTSAGLQAVRLQYYEFFSKFYYEGGAGDAYEPFGHEGHRAAE